MPRRNLLLIALSVGVLTVLVLSTQSAWCQDQPPTSAEAKRIEALVNKAAALVDAKGKAAFTEFRQQESEWWSGTVYVFAYAPDGTVILNPAFPAREGKAYHGEKDKKGKAFHDELMKTARTKGSGWVDLLAPQAGPDRAIAEMELRQGSEGRRRPPGRRRLLSGVMRSGLSVASGGKPPGQ